MMTLQVNKSYEAWRYCRALNPEEEGVWQVPRSCCIPNLVIFILIFYQVDYCCKISSQSSFNLVREFFTPQEGPTPFGQQNI